MYLLLILLAMSVGVSRVVVIGICSIKGGCDLSLSFPCLAIHRRCS